MIVRATNKDFAPRLRMRWSEVVALRELLDFLWSQRTKELLSQFAQKRIAEAVNRLEMFEQQYQSLEMGGFQFSVNAVKRMRNRVRDVRAGEISLERENVIANDLNVLVLLFGDAPNQNVNFARVLRKISRNLLTNECVGQIANLETAIDRVVVRDRDKIHPPVGQLFVQLARVRITVGKF